MAAKERNQNPVVGDLINLRLITRNSNNYADVNSVEKVDIYYLDPVGTPDDCVDKCKKECTKRLVQSFTANQLTHEGDGKYLLPLQTSAPTYTIGSYVDEWSVIFKQNDSVSIIDNRFSLYPDLWFTSTIPSVYGFSFNFQPNRIRHGCKKWLIIQIVPNVPRKTDLEEYYTNLAISSTMKIWIEQNCGPCVPAEQDLRMIVDGDLVSVRDKVYGFYQLDTRCMDCGIYNLWVELDYEDSIEVSPKMQLQIF